MSDIDVRTPSARAPDAFGLARLALAALVIVAHTPELHDGDRGREILTRMFGTLSFGELAVDGFFVVSGFLVTGSYLATRSVPLFAAKRAARLLPGFLLATAIGLAIVAPLAGGAGGVAWPQAAWSIATLHDVAAPTAFHGLPYPALNGAMWTLSFEARCYALVVLLGVTGLLRRPLVLAALAGACLVGQIVAPVRLMRLVFEDPVGRALFDEPYVMLRLAGQFLAGAALWHGRQALRPTWWRAGLAVAILIAGLSRPLLAEAATATAGAWLILSIAMHPPAPWMARVNQRDDISYGVYLYAWPITELLLWWIPGLPLAILAALTLAGSAAMGLISWRLVEKPVQMALRGAVARRRARRVSSRWALG